MNVSSIHICVYSTAEFLVYREMKVHLVSSPVCGDAVGLGVVTMVTANRAVPGQTG
jgi:hypothetical protein